MRKLLLLTAAIAGAVINYAAAPAAGQDHLFCYDVNDKLKPNVAVDLSAVPQGEFSQKSCTVTKVTKFCVPAVKTVLPPAVPGPNIVGPPLGPNDYVCYQVDCKDPHPVADKLVVDQFGQRRQRKYKPSELCVPAEKASPPCFRIGTSKNCGGVCPNDTTGVGNRCVFDDTLQDCTCGPQPCGGKPDKTGQCGGKCDDPALTCVLEVDASGKTKCDCGNPPPPPCDQPVGGTCGGSCLDPAAKCVMNPSDGGPPCICQPPVAECHRDTASANMCSNGPCPPGFQCVLEAAIDDCRCEPIPQGCGPNPFTGQCGGTCTTAGTECRFVPATPGNPGGCNCVP